MFRKESRDSLKKIVVWVGRFEAKEEPDRR